MATKKKVTPPVAESDQLTEEEKKALTAGAKAVKKSRKNQPAPQLLSKLGPDDVVDVLTVPLVRWVFKSNSFERELNSAQIKCKVKDLDAFKAQISNEESAIEFYEYYERKISSDTKFHVSDRYALAAARKDIIGRVEKLEIDMRYNKRTANSAATKLFALCQAFRALDTWEKHIGYISEHIKDKSLRVIPSKDHFVFDADRGEFVPREVSKD